MRDVQHIKGQKIEGFFGFFDILGYSELNKPENNDIDKLIEIFNNSILNIGEKAITLNCTDKDQRYFIGKVEILVFSDTIILYQKMPEQLPDIGSSFIFKSCLLLRLAFEAGIPLRGAISYGEYYIHDRCFLGAPIIEAREDEKAQNWSGAVLCKSVEEKYQTLVKKHQEAKTDKDMFNFFDSNLIVEYPVPYYDDQGGGYDKEKHQKYALRWDDFGIYSVDLLNIPELNRGKNRPSIQKRIMEQFAEHNKLKPDERVEKRVETKINNTAEFIDRIKDPQRVRGDTLVYIPNNKKK